jgi:hypothetical protein
LIPLAYLRWTTKAVLQQTKSNWLFVWMGSVSFSVKKMSVIGTKRGYRSGRSCSRVITVKDRRLRGRIQSVSDRAVAYVAESSP